MLKKLKLITGEQFLMFVLVFFIIVTSDNELFNPLIFLPYVLFVNVGVFACIKFTRHIVKKINTFIHGHLENNTR